MSVPQATVLASICSLFSAVIVAWIIGFFDQSKTEITKDRDEVVEQVRKESSIKTEEIRQLTAKIVEDARYEGTINLEKFKLQRDLILQAIETIDRVEAQKRLRFFAKIGLIPDYAEQVIAFTEQTSITEIPSFSQDVIKSYVPGWSGQFPQIMSRMIRILDSGTSVCSGLIMNKMTVLSLSHCINEDRLSDYSLEQNGSHPSTSRSGVFAIEKSRKIGTPYGSDQLVLLELDTQLGIDFEEIQIRDPSVNEDILVIGYASTSNTSNTRGLSRPTDYRKIAVGCKLIESDQYAIELNCDAPQGTSGNIIIGQDDGAILGMVAWGSRSADTGRETIGGPILSKYVSQDASFIMQK